MPVDQKKGSKGFFIINLIPTFWLRFSSFLRRINLDIELLALAGIAQNKKGIKTLNVNVLISGYLPYEFSHLHSFRNVRGGDIYYLLNEKQSILS